jgi:TRAP-type uncharacterized transport system substrate-binding protein
MNSWTVGIAGGPLEGAPIRFAAEIARVVDDGPNLQVLPIVTRGVTDNVNALLYQKGIDAAIINTDVLQTSRAENPNVQSKVVNLLSLFPSEVHIFVRPEINSVEDLTGKKVNFNTQGTAAAYTGPIIFERLGISVDKMFVPHPIAIEQMRKGEVAAVVFVTSKPIETFQRGRWDPNFKFLDINFDDRFSDYYLPATFDSQDYPNLIGQGQRVRTIAVPTALVGFNWLRNSDRYRRLARMTEYLFDRFEQLQEPGFHPKWKDVNLAATVPGLERFAAADEWLKRYQNGDSTPQVTGSGNARIDPGLARAQAARAVPYNRAEQERLFREFLEWRRARP